MNNLKNYTQYNESILGEFSRLNPKRYKNDVKAATLFEEMQEDFEKYGRNLRKVKVLKDNNKISFSRIELGTRGNLTYNFGKYHPTTNNIHTGNKRAGNRTISINYRPLVLVFKRNELERAFNTSIFKNTKIEVEEVRVIDNPIYNPNISRNLGLHESPTKREREMMVMYKEIEDRYTISGDVAIKILNYFIKEYDKQYPQLTGTYRGPMGIDEIEKGVSPTLYYIHGRDINGKEVTASFHKGDNEKDILNLMKSMTKEEFDKIDKEKKEKEYAPFYAKKKIESDVIKEACKNAITPLLKKYNLVEDNLEFRIYEDNIQINLIFNSPKSAIQNKVKDLCSEFPPIPNGEFEYVYDHYHVSDGWRNDNLSFATIFLENTEFME
jgi:hypothetical protein